MRGFPGGATRGAVPSSSSSFASMMRSRQTERDHSDPTGLPALVHSSHNPSPTPASPLTTARTASAPDMSPGMPALAPVTYTITDTTTRKELLSIVQQLQTALNDRTDSVNLIQRNFTRLSGMYRRDRDELERVSELLRQYQHAPQESAQTEALEQELRQMKEALEQADQRARVSEATHNAELAVHAETERGLREALAEAQDEVARAEETTTRAAQAQESREQALRTSLSAQQQASARSAREVGLFLQQLHVAVGEAPPPLLAQPDEPDAATSSEHTVGAVLLQSVQDALLETIRGLRRACVVSASDTETAALAQARAARRLVSQLADAEREARACLEEAEADARHHVTSGRDREGQWWARLHDCAEAARADEREVLGAAHAEERASLATAAAQQAAAHARAVDALEAQLAAGALGTSADADLIAAQRQQLVEAQSRVQALLSDNKRLTTALSETRREAEAALATERAALARQHQEAMQRLRDQLRAEQARDLSAAQAQSQRVASTEAAQSTAAALAAQRTSLEGQFRLSLEALRLEATRAELILSMQHMIVEAEADERHHIALEETGSREDLQYTLRAMAARTAMAQQQHHHTTRQYLSLALLASEQQTRAALEVEHANALAVLARDGHAQLERASREHTARLAARAEAAEVAANNQREATHAAQTQREQSQSASQAQLQTVEAERGRLEILYTKLCGENGQLVSRVKAQKETMRDLHARATTQQQVAVAALKRLQAAEEASESSYSCPICFQLFNTPVTCVPCGHTYCKACLSSHPRNRQAASHSHSTADLMCPECGFSTVDRCIQTRALDQLAHTFQYKQQVLKEILHTLEEQQARTATDLASASTSSASSPLSQTTKSRLGSTKF